MMNNDEQIEEYEVSFCTYICEKENNKELKKNDVKGKKQFNVCDTFLQRENQRLSLYNLHKVNPSLIYKGKGG